MQVRLELGKASGWSLKTMVKEKHLKVTIEDGRTNCCGRLSQR